jgi:cold shock CspA family protein
VILTGRVKWFDINRHIGFITVEGDDYIFGTPQVIRYKKKALHLPRHLRKSIGMFEGATVTFEGEISEKGGRVVEILSINRSTEVPRAQTQP